MQKLTIRNLGPVKEFDADISKINLLIGEQATGKSTISKCVYFFRSIKNAAYEAIRNQIFFSHDQTLDFPASLYARLKDIYHELFGFSWDLKMDMYLKYSIDEDIFVEARTKVNDREEKYVEIKLSPILLKKLEGILSYFYVDDAPDSDSENLPFSLFAAERERVVNEMITAINEIFQDDMETYYIPAGRNLLTLMFNQKTKIDYDALDLVNRNFMRFIEHIQSKFDMGIKQAHKYYPDDKRNFDAAKLANSIVSYLKGDYYFSKGEESLFLNEGEKIKINFASSGQQEILWLLLHLYVLLLKKEKAFIIIEEPETHLYPSLQKFIFEYIVQFANLNNSGVLVTTHSPYILMSANTLYKAGTLLSTAKKEDVKKLLGKNKYIDPDSFTAFKLLASGQHENLVNTQTGELETSLIDEISDEINAVYSELFYLEADREDSK